ncbi:Metallo-dependent hydrolase [Patellaria atrata CBS 101060]|uniref:Dipeptidase n=1 Tax=Patellaria atrata CBS 101060 TaxID=1346257 RepID=A0A9P4SDC0_9PEZI|nr:Metallo-dependent hydrolase [Patellaria atrata CBS 101060]
MSNLASAAIPPEQRRKSGTAWSCLSVSIVFLSVVVTNESRVRNIMETTPLIVAYSHHIYQHNFTYPFEEGDLEEHVDLARLQKGRVGGMFWSVFADCPKKALSNCGSAVDCVHRLLAKYSSSFERHDNSEAAIEMFRVRYATLTHNCHNIYADSTLVDLPEGGVEAAQPHWGGVSEKARKIIHEMNRLGMIVDLAHVSWPGSKAPPIFSHSSAFTICPRKVPDDVLQLVKARNSLVMVTFSPDFVSCCFPNDIADGLQDDFDGMPTTPRGLEDVSKFPDLVAEMLKQGISDTHAEQIIGGNLLRVWGGIDRVATVIKEEGELPVEDDLPYLENPW